MEKEKTHPPAARDCLRCHKPHSSGEAALMTRSVQSLCAECHDYKTAGFGKSHIYIDGNVMDCSHCHSPHASKDPKFFKEVVHVPFAGRSCDDCHIVEKR
jgi:predicted CXXCH cytochrome family protein